MHYGIPVYVFPNIYSGTGYMCVCVCVCVCVLFLFIFKGYIYIYIYIYIYVKGSSCTRKSVIKFHSFTHHHSLMYLHFHVYTMLSILLSIFSLQSFFLLPYFFDTQKIAIKRQTWYSADCKWTSLTMKYSNFQNHFLQ